MAGKRKDAPSGARRHGSMVFGSAAPGAADGVQERLVGGLRFAETLMFENPWEWGWPEPLQARAEGGASYVVDLSARVVNVVKDFTGGEGGFEPALPASEEASRPRRLDFVLDCTDSPAAPAVSWPDSCAPGRRPF